MNLAQSIIQQVRSYQVNIRPRPDGMIGIKPFERLPPELVEAIKQHKREVINELIQQEQEAIEQQQWQELKRYAQVLHETMLDHKEANLRKKGYPAYSALVRLEEWRKAVMYAKGLIYAEAMRLQTDLLQDGAIVADGAHIKNTRSYEAEPRIYSSDTIRMIEQELARQPKPKLF